MNYMFTLLDVILIAIIMFFAAVGFVWGFIRTLGAIVGVFFGLWAATNFSFYAADWLASFLGGHDFAAKIIAFIVIFGLADLAVKIVFWFISKIFSLISIIPFLKPLNRLGGLILGLVGGILILGLVIYIVATNNFLTGYLGWLVNILNESRVANWLVRVTQFLTALFP